jgi:hypothetical protein
VVVEFMSRSSLLDRAIPEDDHVIGELERFLLVVGDEDRGDVGLLMKPMEPPTELGSNARVERPEWFIQEQYLRLRCDGTSQGYSLFLSTG